MRKFVYLAVLFVLLILSIEYMRKYSVAIVKRGDSYVIEAEELEDEKTVVADYLTAVVAEKEGNFEKAVEYYEKALLENPQNTKILDKIYGIYLFLGDFDKAFYHAKRHIEILKSNNVKIDKTVNPTPFLLLALKDYNKSEIKALNVGRILEPMVDPSIPDRSHIDGIIIPLLLSWSYVIDSNYKAAFDVIDKITTSYMLSVFSYNRAIINDISNEKNEVLEEIKGANIYEKSKVVISDIFGEIGSFSFQGQNFEEAVVYLRLASYLDPEKFKYKKLLASAFEVQKRYNEAAEIYESIGESDKHYNDVQLSLAILYNKMKKNAESIKILRRLSYIDKYEYQVLLAIGMIKLEEKNYKDAIELFDSAERTIEEFTAANWSLYFNMGVAYDRLGDWKNAEQALKRSIELFPNNPETLNYLAYSWLVKGKNKENAIKMLEDAVVRSGGAPHILDSYGWALYQIGNYEQALPFLEQAAKAMPYNSVINSHLGDVYSKLGRNREARYIWQRAYDYFKEEEIEEITKEELKAKINNAK